MRLTSSSFQDGAVIPGEYAFCIPNDRGHVCLGQTTIPICGGTMFPLVHNHLL